MVLKVQPIYRAVEFIKAKVKNKKAKTRTILFSARGKKLNAEIAERLSRYDNLILICGRYEGVDERVAKYVADEEVSIGDYILSGGELPALVLMESVSRFLPGFLGKEESLEEVNGSFPTYTRPDVFYHSLSSHSSLSSRRTPGSKAKQKWSVPKVLLLGDHKKIAAWRKEQGYLG